MLTVVTTPVPLNAFVGEADPFLTHFGRKRVPQQSLDSSGLTGELGNLYVTCGHHQGGEPVGRYTVSGQSCAESGRTLGIAVQRQPTEERQSQLWQILQEERFALRLATLKAKENGYLTFPTLRYDSSSDSVLSDVVSGHWVIQAKSRLSRAPAEARIIAITERGAPLQWRKWSRKLERIVSRKPDACDNTPSPTAIASRNAAMFLDVLEARDYPPAQLLPSVVGGIGFAFRDQVRKAYVEFTNKGSVNVLLSDGKARPRVSGVTANALGYSLLIDDIKAYLNEQHSAQHEAKRTACSTPL
jgi:hypothetical protein